MISQANKHHLLALTVREAYHRLPVQSVSLFDVPDPRHIFLSPASFGAVLVQVHFEKVTMIETGGTDESHSLAIWGA